MENVVQLVSKKSNLKAAQSDVSKIETTALPLQAATGTDFASLMERNAFNRDRLKREREQANKGVLKSYRIK